VKRGFLGILLVVAFSQVVFALNNPAYVYCTKVGFEYQGTFSADGSSGTCKLSNENIVNAWAFLQGKEAPDKGFCSQSGYAMKTVMNRSQCAAYGTEECAVCLVDGHEIEVGRLMNLSFEETFCGDGTCGIPENARTCPIDCQALGRDRLCEGEDDPDCAPVITERMIVQAFLDRNPELQFSVDDIIAGRVPRVQYKGDTKKEVVGVQESVAKVTPEKAQLQDAYSVRNKLFNKILVIIVVLVLLSGGIGGYFFLKKSRLSHSKRVKK